MLNMIFWQIKPCYKNGLDSFYFSPSYFGIYKNNKEQLDTLLPLHKAKFGDWEIQIKMFYSNSAVF